MLYKLRKFRVHGNNRNESIKILLQLEYLSTRLQATTSR